MMKAKLMTAALVVMAGASLADAKKPTAEEKARAEQVKQECDALHKELSQTSHGHYGYGVYSVGFAYRYGVFDGETWSEEKIAAAERRALEIRRRLVELRPGDVREHLELGALLMYFGQERNDAALFKEALAEMEKAAGLVTFVKGKNDRLFAETRFWLADAQFAAGDRAAAQATLESVVEKKLNTWQRHAADWARYASDALLALKGNSFDRMELPLGNDARAFPEPQQAKYTEEFTKLGDVLLKLDGIDEDDVRIRLLKTKLSRIGAKVEVAGLFGGLFSGAYPISVALDPEAPVDKPEGYSLTVEADGVSIRARDRQGVLWGIVSTIQLVNRDTRSIRHCEISDWPDAKDRGWLNNFFADATEYILFVKGNSCCHQHNPTEGNYMTPLRTFTIAEQAREYKAFGLTLYYGLRWISHCEQLAISEPRTLPFCIEVCKRYAKMGAGVYYPLDDIRFPVLKEDLAKYGSARAIDAKHVSEIFRAVRKEYPDFRMVFCPPFYWGPDGRARYPEGRDPYLKSLAEELDPAIEVYWTGPRVKSYKFEPYQIDWYTKLIGRKPYLFQNGIGWHNLLHYTVDEIDWPKMYFDGCLTDGLAAYHLNAHTPGDCPRIASLADALWNIPAFNAERGVKRGVQQIMGEKAYDLLAPGEPAHYYFDKWRYGAADDRVLDVDFDDLERKLATIETCWSNELAYARANGYPIYGDYGRGVDFARKIVGYARNPPNLAKKFRVLVSDAKELATREAKFDEKAGDIFRSPADMSGGRVFCLKRNPADADERGTLVRGLRPAGSKLAAVTFSFECDPFPPEGDYRLVLSLQGEPGPLRVSVNGTTVSESNSGISPAFSRKEFTLPVSALKRGNAVKIENLAPGKDEGQGTVLVAYAVMKRR